MVISEESMHMLKSTNLLSDHKNVKNTEAKNEYVICCCLTGWVSSVHWGAAASRQVLLLHLVQPASRQTKVFQEAREEDVPRGGTTL